MLLLGLSVIPCGWSLLRLPYSPLNQWRATERQNKMPKWFGKGWTSANAPTGLSRQTDGQTDTANIGNNSLQLCSSCIRFSRRIIGNECWVRRTGREVCCRQGCSLGLETVSRRTNVSPRSRLDKKWQRLGLVYLRLVPKTLFSTKLYKQH